MKKGEYAVILVRSSNHALRAESLLKKAGVLCKLIPVPRNLSSDCGTCIRILRFDRDRALAVLKGGGLETDGIHPV